MALLWAAGICWMAVDYVGVAPESGNDTSANQDITGTDTSSEQIRQVEDALKHL